MSETETASGSLANGAQHRTIYLQGNKQRVDAGAIQMITDLDKGLLYVIDKQHKAFVATPLRTQNDLAPPGDELYSKTIELKRTGTTRIVAHHRCDEYSGKTENDQVRLKVSACVSGNAPGAAEIASFRREMISQLEGFKPPPSSHEPAAIVLDKQSVISLRMPEPFAHRHQFASQTTRIRIDRIKVKALPAQTFALPRGYSQIQPPPEDTSPDEGEVQSIIMLKVAYPQTAPFALSRNCFSKKPCL